MGSIDLCYLSIAQAAAGLRRLEFSPVDLTQACLDRISAVDDKLHSFITVSSEFAMAQAREAQWELLHAKDRGPLHGIPVALKDLFKTRGIRTTAHSRVLMGWLPSEDATAVIRLKEAGAVLLGKLAMHEFAISGPAFDTPFPPARNPWNLHHVPGGSSSGSGAALAGGLCFGSLGSDTGGSIRWPASWCSIVGLKPTYGLVSRFGIVPLSWSLDHAGPMARTVEDCALLLQAIAGHDPEDPTSVNVSVPGYLVSLSQGVKGLRLGVPYKAFDEAEGTDLEVIAALEAALKVLEGLGANIVEVDGSPFAISRNAHSVILSAEAYAYHEQHLKSCSEDYGSGLRKRLRSGAFLSAVDYIQAQRARTALIARMQEMLTTVDALVTPTWARPASTFADFDPETMYRTPSFTSLFNLTGLPAISVPCGFTANNLPIGMQIAGPPFAESAVLRIAYSYEQATPWHCRRASL